MLCAIGVHAQKLKINTVPEGLQKAYLDGKDTVPIVNLREIYIEAYTQKEASEYIFRETTKELHQIFGSYLPGLTLRGFYEMEIGSASIMRGYMAHPCDDELTLEKKLRLFLTMSLRVMQQLFKVLAMHFEFSLQGIEKANITKTEGIK